jgi:hypothetical protein
MRQLCGFNGDALGFCGQAKVKGIASGVVSTLVPGESERAWHFLGRGNSLPALIVQPCA